MKENSISKPNNWTTHQTKHGLGKHQNHLQNGLNGAGAMPSSSQSSKPYNNQNNLSLVSSPYLVNNESSNYNLSRKQTQVTNNTSLTPQESTQKSVSYKQQTGSSKATSKPQGSSKSALVQQNSANGLKVGGGVSLTQ